MWNCAVFTWVPWNMLSTFPMFFKSDAKIEYILLSFDTHVSKNTGPIWFLFLWSGQSMLSILGCLFGDALIYIYMFCYLLLEKTPWNDHNCHRQTKLALAMPVAQLFLKLIAASHIAVPLAFRPNHRQPGWQPCSSQSEHILHILNRSYATTQSPKELPNVSNKQGNQGPPLWSCRITTGW